MKHRINYIVNIWLTSAVIGLSIFSLGHYLAFLDEPTPTSNSNDLYSLLVLGAGVLLMLFFTAPIALCLLGYLSYLNRTALVHKSIKQLLALAAISLCALIFVLFSVFLPHMSHLVLLILSCYLLPLVGSVFFYQLNTKTNQLTTSYPINES